MRRATIRVSPDALLSWLDFEGGRLMHAKLDYSHMVLEFTVEHADLPEMPEGWWDNQYEIVYAKEVKQGVTDDGEPIEQTRYWRSHPPKGTARDRDGGLPANIQEASADREKLFSRILRTLSENGSLDGRRTDGD